MNKKFILTLSTAVILSATVPTYAKMSSQSYKLYNSAIAQEQAGNYQQALDYVKKALVYSPDDAILNIKIAGLYENLNQTQEAINAYKKAISLREGDGFLYISLGNLYMQQYDYKNGLESYEKAQTLVDDYKYNYINIANARNLLGDNQGAIEAYNKFLESYPNNLEGQSAIANI